MQIRLAIPLGIRTESLFDFRSKAT
jgi:hypothetical protein